ncbi:MAG: hypothetical protein AAFU67_17020, partial [Bacteroidota bacterium]
MKYYSFLFCSILLAGCSYWENQEDAVIISITDIENTDEGTLITFSATADDDIILTGIDYRRPSQGFIRGNQVLLEDPNPEQQVLIPALDDGPTFFRAFAATEDIYGYSQEVNFEVISSAPNPPCVLAANTISSNVITANCQGSDLRVSGAMVDDEYQISVNCQFLDLDFLFPRNPTSGVYRTVDFIDRPGSSDKEVVVSLITSGSFARFRTGQEITVQRQNNGTTI